MVWSKIGVIKMNKQMKTFEKYCGDDRFFISILSIAITTLFFGSVFDITQIHTILDWVTILYIIIMYSFFICGYYYIQKSIIKKVQIRVTFIT